MDEKQITEKIEMLRKGLETDDPTCYKLNLELDCRALLPHLLDRVAELERWKQEFCDLVKVRDELIEARDEIARSRDIYYEESQRLKEELSALHQAEKAYTDKIAELQKKLATWERIAERDHGKPPGSFRELVAELVVQDQVDCIAGEMRKLVKTPLGEGCITRGWYLSDLDEIWHYRRDARSEALCHKTAGWLRGPVAKLHVGIGGRVCVECLIKAEGESVIGWGGNYDQ